MRSELRRRVQGLVGVLLVASMSLALSGCIVTGGGWLDSAIDPAKKATFAFNGECTTSNGLTADFVRGNLQYNDHGGAWGPNGLSVQAHGVVNGTLFNLCLQPVGNPQVIFTGKYEPQPKKLGPGGTFTVAVFDGGEPGPSNGDSVDVAFTGGVFDGYRNTGALEGGNIQLGQ